MRQSHSQANSDNDGRKETCHDGMTEHMTGYNPKSTELERRSGSRIGSTLDKTAHGSRLGMESGNGKREPEFGVVWNNDGSGQCDLRKDLTAMNPPVFNETCTNLLCSFPCIRYWCWWQCSLIIHLYMHPQVLNNLELSRLRGCVHRQ
jgi:hypothetical protein